MNFLLIIPYYFVWHYSKGIADYFRVLGNLIWFLWNYFSVAILFRTFFMPFERLGEKTKSVLDIKSTLSAFVINSLMRIIGMLIRAAVILAGLASCLVLATLGVFGLFVWIFLPFILIWLVAVSLIAIKQ